MGAVSFVDRKELAAYLAGTETEFVDSSVLARPEALKIEKEVKEMSKDDWLKEIRSHERSFYAKDVQLAGKFNCASVCKVCRTAKEEKKEMPSSMVEGISVTKTGSRVPIVIVPAAPSALLTLYNAKELLFNDNFVPSTEMKARGFNKEPVIRATRPNGAVYHLIDNPQRLRPEDWKRIVAVVVQGAEWQFKGWKWSDPLELFSKCLGFHFKYDDTKAEENVLKWNVHLLNVSKSKRHLDKTVAVEFWDFVDKSLLAKPYLSG